jgi:multiple sugar transport system permease protein
MPGEGGGLAGITHDGTGVAAGSPPFARRTGIGRGRPTCAGADRRVKTELVKAEPRAAATQGRAADGRISVVRAARRYLPAYLFILPSFAAFIIFTAYPLVDTLVFSLQDLRGGARIWIGLENYRAMLHDEVFLASARNTILYFVAMVPGGVLLAVLLSALIYLVPSSRLRTFFKAAYYLPTAACSSVILALVWNYLYDPAFGLLNYGLGLVGLPPQRWLNDIHLALPSLALMMHTQWWGGMIILLTASMGAVPADLYEGAVIDGASTATQFFAITLPLIRPAIVYVTIIATISSLRIFNEILLMTRGGPAWATVNIAYDIWLTGINAFKFGPAAAYATVLLAATMLFAVFQFRLLSVDIEY